MRNDLKFVLIKIILPTSKHYYTKNICDATQSNLDIVILYTVTSDKYEHENKNDIHEEKKFFIPNNVQLHIDKNIGMQDSVELQYCNGDLLSRLTQSHRNSYCMLVLMDICQDSLDNMN